MNPSTRMVSPSKNGLPPTWESCVAGIRKRARFQSRKEAEAWTAQRVVLAENKQLFTARELRAQARAATRTKAAVAEAEARLSISAMLDEFMVAYESEVERNTYERYRGLVVRLKEAIGHLAVNDFRPEDVKPFLRKFGANGGKNGRPLSRSSAQQAAVVLRQAFANYRELKLIASNPMSEKVKMPLKKSDPRVPPTDDEVRRLLDVPEDKIDLAVPIYIAVTCGLRRGEMLALTWASLDLDRCDEHGEPSAMLSVVASVEEVRQKIRLKPPKTQSSARSISVPEECVAVLRAHRKRQIERALLMGAAYDRKADLVVPDPSGNGQLWQPSKFTDRFRRHCRALGVKSSYHDLRHYHASALIAAGVDAKTVSERLGHTNVGFTLTRYVKTASDSDQRAARIMSEYLIRKNRAALAGDEGRDNSVTISA